MMSTLSAALCEDGTQKLISSHDLQQVFGFDGFTTGIWFWWIYNRYLVLVMFNEEAYLAFKSIFNKAPNLF